MKSNSRYTKELEELLESDDDLPSEYNEITDIPAYQDDNRFASSRFTWIEYEQESDCPAETSPHSAEESSYATTSQSKKDEKLLIRKGLLKKQDVYCLKSIEALISDSTLLWFVDYLMCKDIQSSCNFFRSCLVGNIIDHFDLKYEPSVCNHNVDVKNYNLVFNQ